MKKREKLAPIPKRRKASSGSAGDGQASPRASGDAAPPDLSYIVEGLRSLAIPVGDVHFDPSNPMTHDEGNIEAIAGSLAVYGQRKPIVVNKRTNAVEAGNGTLQATLQLGRDFIAAVFVDDDPATEAGYKIADNRTAQLAEWDKEAVDKLVREVNTSNDPRLDKMMADLHEELLPTPKDGKDQSDDVPTRWDVLIECGSEEKQLAMIEQLEAEGHKCRALTS